MTDKPPLIGPSTTWRQLLLTLMALAIAGSAGPFNASAQQADPVANPQQRYLTGEDLEPLDARRAIFEWLDGDQTGEQVRVLIQKADDEQQPGPWEIIIEDQRKTIVTRDSDGIHIHQLIRYDDNQRIVYQPAILMLPARIDPSRSIQQEGQATVYDIRTGEQEYQGAYQHQVGIRGQTTISTPNGEKLKTILVQMDHKVSLDMATLRLSVITGYSPGIGRVYHRTDTTLTKVGIFPESDVSTMIWLRDLPQPQAKAD